MESENFDPPTYGFRKLSDLVQDKRLRYPAYRRQTSTDPCQATGIQKEGLSSRRGRLSDLPKTSEEEPSNLPPRLPTPELIFISPTDLHLYNEEQAHMGE
ncbi:MULTISPECIES: hypothetical protein [Ensifer]|uniref:hypothetical protein n=1 Tax=Ensifer TaxID=106591 RepID=UPI000A656E49|nr:MULTISPECIES: hypothetical protein [Ensifer]MBD9595899.1 hypothetical protein [Ensifer sp. ENS05]MDF8356549.1 hypothetical protein [Ensifer adhaerens]